MQLTQLKIFHDVARSLSFVRAAALNTMSQPGVSFQVKKLEDELGTKLFERASRSIRLTSAGARLVPKVEEILTRVEGLRSTALEEGTPSGDLRVASIISVGVYELDAFLTGFLQTFPNVQLSLQYRHAGVIYDLVRRGRIDVGLVAYPESRPGIEVIPCGSDELVLIAPKDHRLAAKSTVTLKDIGSEDFLAFDDGLPTGEALRKAFSKARITPHIRMHNDNIYALKKAVQAGLGVAIVPRSCVREELAFGWLAAVGLKGFDARRPLAIIRARKGSRAPQIDLFINLLVDRGIMQ